MSSEKASKIALLGLAAAGKTSFLEALQQEFGALYNIKATIGVNRNRIRILGTDLYMHDFGGQQRYREEYLKDPRKYLSGTDLMFYFVDVQDMESLDNSVDYFKNLLDLKELQSVDPANIFIFIHKMDPAIRNDPRVRSRVKKIRERFNNIKKVEYFETSIHDYWSIIFSFSKAFKRIKKIKEILTKLLKEFARATFSSGIILLDNNFLILDEHASNEENLQITNAAFQDIINIWAKKAVNGDPPDKLQKDLEDGKAYFQQFKYEEEIYYITAYSRNPRTEKLILEKLPGLANRVFEILMGYYFEEA